MTSTVRADASTGLQLVLDVCEAIKEDNDERIVSLLEINSREGNNASATAEEQTPAGDCVSSSYNNKAEALLQSYYNILGHTKNSSGDEGFPPDQAHLVLEALLRISSLDLSLSSISW